MTSKADLVRTADDLDAALDVAEAEIERLRWALHLIAEGHIAPKMLAVLVLDGPDSPERTRPERTS